MPNKGDSPFMGVPLGKGLLPTVRKLYSSKYEHPSMSTVGMSPCSICVTTRGPRASAGFPQPSPLLGGPGSFATWMCTRACANLFSRTQLIRSKRQTRKKRRFTDTGPHFTGFLVTCFFPLGKASRL